MLVLSRGEEESIMIGDDVEVTILRIHGNRVSLGVAAPKEIPIHRKEALLKRQTEHEQDLPKL